VPRESVRDIDKEQFILSPVLLIRDILIIASAPSLSLVYGFIVYFSGIEVNRLGVSSRSKLQDVLHIPN